jgi:diguanylate cyclase (GGDEF)-like protein/PAS domain S-box-containing protein
VNKITRIRDSWVLAWQDARIQTQFALLLTVLSLPFFLLISWSAREEENLAETRSKIQAEALARLAAARLDDQVHQVDQLLVTATSGISARPEDRERNDLALRKLRPFVPEFVDNLAIWDPHGNNVGTMDTNLRTSPFNIADRSYFRKAILTGDLVIEAPLVSRLDHEFIAQFARPLYDDLGQLVGVVTATVRLRRLELFLDGTEGLPPDSLVSVVDALGTVLVRSIDPDNSIGKRLPDVAGIQDAFSIGHGSRELDSLDGVPRFGGYRRTRFAPWMVFIGLPLENATAPIRAQFYRRLIYGACFIALAALVAVWLGRRVSGPLVRLTEDARRFAEGDLLHRSTAMGGCEVNGLARALNQMAQSLEARTNEVTRHQAWLQSITDAVPALIGYVDREDRYRFANRRYQMLGLDPEKIIGELASDVLPAESYREARPYALRALEGESVTFEYQRSAHGKMRDVVATYLPDFGPDGQVEGFFILNQDITDQKVIIRALANSEERLRMITDNIPALVCLIDRNHFFRFNNRTYEKWLRRPLEEVTGHSVREVYGNEIYATLAPYIARALGGERVKFETEFLGFDGKSHCSRGVYVPHIESDGSVSEIYGLITDVTSIKRAEEQMRQLAQFDTLTELANRHQMNERLTAALKLPDNFAVMFLDIDRFKRINDTMGHEAGDEVLKEVARRIQQSVRPTDLAARLAGDEFVVLLEGLNGSAEAQFVARKILNAIQQPFGIKGFYEIVTTSIGVAVRRASDTDGKELLRRADQALYAAKAAGRNCFQVVA